MSIPGFAVSDCDPIRRDTLRGTLSWNGGSSWPEVSQEKQARYPNLPKSEFYIKLHFYISPDTKLYMVRLDPPEVIKCKDQGAYRLSTLILP